MIGRKFHVEHLKRVLLLTLFVGSSFVSAAQDLLIINAKVRTVSGNDGDVDAIKVVDGKIAALENKPGLWKGKYALIDLKHKGVVYPGLIDAHCHFTGYALDKYKCNLYGTKSKAEIVSRLKVYSLTNKMPYVYGTGWDQNDWSVKEFPDKSLLDDLFPNTIVILKRVDGHAILVNQYTLDKAGVKSSSQISGGQVIMKNGEPTGMLIDNAMVPAEALIPALPESTARSYLKEMEMQCFKDGLTYVVDCGLPAVQIDLLSRLYTHNFLQMGMTALLSADSTTLNQYANARPFRIGQLSVSGIKMYADGALGSRGACLLAPYTDDPRNSGTMLMTASEMVPIGYLALRNGWQLCTHAIGDSANRTVLKVYDLLLSSGNNERWRIEHAQVVDPADYKIFGRKGIVPSVQPTHATTDMSWAIDRLGKERIHNAYSYKALLDETGYIALGTDFPVEAINPLATFYAAVTRKDAYGNPAAGFNPEGALSRVEALKGMTIWAAKSVFKEAEKGSIEEGKDADFTILDTDLLTCSPQDILKAKVLYTIVNGHIVYKK